ncbi:aminodeoxychorismate synthase component I [Alteromonas sp. CYL-A6]|uniref:aminodeoxychorismate synthase component I n=1 Tax=Alteromonas nitratireducens TaxID=3390813 RepID=UPI0034C14798
MPEMHANQVIIEPVSLPESHCLSDVFASVSQTEMATLLDSAGGQQDGRFSVMLWSPFRVIRTRHGKTLSYCCETGHTELHNSTPFQVVADCHKQYFSDLTIHPDSRHLADRLPFIIGVAGFAGYDIGRCYETLPNHANDDYRCADLAVGCFTQSLIQDNQTGQVYHCRLASLPVLDRSFLFSGDDDRSSGQPFTLTSPWRSNLTKVAYVDALHRIDAYLNAGDCYQVNMAQRFSAACTGDPFEAYQRLRQANQAPFSAFIRSEESVILSISPERFLSVDRDGHVQTKPIKGTRPRGNTPEQDAAIANELLSAEKDRAENLMIVDLLRNDISKHCQPGSVTVPALFALESFPAVHHMVSTVTGQLGETSTPLDLLAGAFPGGSITGAPKVRAMEIIDELEPHRRNIYCGSVFYMGMLGDMDSSICIRTLLIENQTIHCWAGGGIVLDSDPLSEYQETLDKVAKILPVLDNS